MIVKQLRCVIGRKLRCSQNSWFNLYFFPDRVANNEWKFATNATDFNRRRMKEQQNLAAKFECVSWRRATKFDTTTILETNLRRQLLRILQQGKCGLGDEKHLEVNFRVFNRMYRIARH